LRPPALENLSLAGAVRDYLNTIGGHGIEIALDVPPSLPSLPPEVDVGAYRILCEALTNVSRHANATRCTVRMRTGDTLRKDVIDDGACSMSVMPSA
jgi:signal transduction histidine kinase